jgi:hypothetical protein
MSFLFLAYGALALGALACCWRDPDMRVVGGALTMSWAGSNLIWFNAPATMRPGVYTMLEIMIVVVAYIAFAVHRRRALVVVVASAILSICANVVLATIVDPTTAQKNLHEWVTNICFAIECIFAAVAGRAVGRPELWDGPVHIGGRAADSGTSAPRDAGPPEP